MFCLACGVKPHCFPVLNFSLESKTYALDGALEVFESNSLHTFFKHFFKHLFEDVTPIFFLRSKAELLCFTQVQRAWVSAYPASRAHACHCEAPEAPPWNPMAPLNSLKTPDLNPVKSSFIAAPAEIREVN